MCKSGKPLAYLGEPSKTGTRYLLLVRIVVAAQFLPDELEQHYQKKGTRSRRYAAEQSANPSSPVTALRRPLLLLLLLLLPTATAGPRRRRHPKG